MRGGGGRGEGKVLIQYTEQANALMKILMLWMHNQCSIHIRTNSLCCNPSDATKVEAQRGRSVEDTLHVGVFT